MPTASRRYKRKSRKGINTLIWLIVLAIFAGGIVFFVTNYYEETKNNLEKASYPQKYSEFVEKYAGEYGLMQMMPSSFEWLQEKRGTVGEYTTDDLFNPEVCIDYGCYLLKYFYDYYGDERCAVAAYNAGFIVGEWLSDSNYSKDGKTLDKIPYPETNNYVDKVESAKEMYIKLYG